MKKEQIMKKRNIILGCVAAALIASTTIAPAFAYFTGHMEAAGTIPIALGSQTEITEDIPSDYTKKEISISNKEGQPVYVRVKVITAESEAKPTGEGEGWVGPVDGYYYYTHPVEVGNPTKILTLSCAEYLGGAQTDAKNVIVVYESVPVRYLENGNEEGYQNADWDGEVIEIP